jgi:hypothetical protein
MDGWRDIFWMYKQSRSRRLHQIELINTLRVTRWESLGGIANELCGGASGIAL